MISLMQIQIRSYVTNKEYDEKEKKKKAGYQAIIDGIMNLEAKGFALLRQKKSYYKKF